MKARLLPIVLVFILIGTIPAAAQIVSNFTVNDEGWTVFDANAGSSSTPVYTSTGGNPGGEISFTTSSPAVRFYWVAPSKFNGNFSRSYNQALTFDLRQSLAGTDNVEGDIILTSSSGIVLFYQLPTKPATGSWSSYSVPLIETAGWKNGCPTCAAATQSQMKQVLFSLAKLQIRLKYFSGNTGPYTAQLDNVVLNVLGLGAAPTITSFTPSSGLPGSNVTITGTNFNTTASQNIVMINNIKAAVTSASSTTLVITVPASTPYGPISVTNLSTGLSGKSKLSFDPLFDNNKDYGGQIIPASFGRGYYVTLPMSNNSNGFGAIQHGDIDGDGWVDLIVTETSTTKIFVYRNLGTGGSVSAASFAAPVSLPSMSAIPGGAPNLGEIVVADFDNDGSLDVAAGTSSNTSGHFTIFRNTSTVGSISFAAPVFFPFAYYSQGVMDAGDLDGDGKIDLISSTGTSPGNLWISQNLSTPGALDFAFGGAVSGTSTSGYSDVMIADMNNDNKPEILAFGYNSAAIYTYQNTSSGGLISMNAPIVNAVPAASNSKITIGDLDSDGKLDIAWSGYGTTNVYVAQNVYSGGAFDGTYLASSLTLPAKTSNPNGVAIGDVNADGKPDIAFVGYYDAGIIQNIATTSTLTVNSFLPGVIVQGSGTGQAINAVGPIIADLDGDNKPELAMVYTNSSVSASEKAVLIFHNESFPAPSITTLSPGSGTIGSSIQLNGGLMNTGSTTPTIRVGSILSNTSSATNTSVNTTVPTSAITNRLSLTEHGLTALSKPFNVSFSTSRTINTSSFGPSVDFALSGNMRDALVTADWDDDGKEDVTIVDNFGTAKIFQNTQSGGQPITSSALALSATTYTASYNMVALDIDGDGKTDLNNGYGLLQNSSTPGSISFQSGPNGIYTYAGGFNTAAAGDFNKDGKIDLAVTNGTANVQVYENQSTRGSFVNNSALSTFNVNAINLAKPDGGGSVVSADFDGDGYDDVIASNPNTNKLSYFLNTKQYGPITASSFQSLGNFSTSGNQPYDITANDFDNDGKPDIAVTYFNSTIVSIYRNISTTGTITFAAPTDLVVLNKGYKITSQDLDGDGLAEIIIAHQPNPGPGSFSVLQNKSSSGTLNFNSAVNYPITRNPQAIAISDINQDQKPDILIVANSGSVGNALMVFENKITTAPVITISQQPVDVSACDGDTKTFTTTATGTTNITYQWQFATTSAGPFNNISDGGGYSGATTSTLSINTTGNFGAGRYRCKIDGDLATTVFTNDEGLFVNTIPAAPTTTGNSKCTAASMTLLASGGTNGQYRWYTDNTGSAIAGETNSSYTTPVISSTTTYYVSINNGTCESTRASVVASISPIDKPSLSFIPSATGSAINLCAGQTQKIVAPAGFKTYAWSNGAATDTIAVTQSGIYSVVVTDAGGCVSSSSDPVTITVNPYPQAVITMDDNTLMTSPGDSYQWYSSGKMLPGETGQSLTFSFLEYGNYAVDVTTNGCTTRSQDFVYLITAAENALSAVNVYPNPVRDELTIETPVETSWQLVNSIGSVIDVPCTENSETKKLSLAGIPAGTYLLIIQSKTSKTYLKILKQE